MAAAKAMAVVRAMASAAGRYDRTGPGCRSAELPATSLGNDSGNKNAQARGPGHNLAAWRLIYQNVATRSSDFWLMTQRSRAPVQQQSAGFPPSPILLCRLAGNEGFF